MPAKKTVFLVHWHAAELKERAARLRAAGYAVRAESGEGGVAAKSLGRTLPAAIVIDLSRLPSHGKHFAVWVREKKRLRLLPLVFVGGEKEKVGTVKKLFPDATFTTWGRIRGALSRAIASPPREVTVPSRRDYSGTPLAKKLGVKEGAALALLGAPDGFAGTLGDLPPNVRVKKQARGSSDVIVLFAKSAAELHRRFPAAQKVLARGGGLWVAWPKKASGLETDLTQAEVRRVGLDSGLVDNKICAIDGTWSGLRFMRRTRS